MDIFLTFVDVFLRQAEASSESSFRSNGVGVRVDMCGYLCWYLSYEDFSPVEYRVANVFSSFFQLIDC